MRTLLPALMLLSILLAACAPAPQPAAPTEPVKTLSTAATAGPADSLRRALFHAGGLVARADVAGPVEEGFR